MENEVCYDNTLSDILVEFNIPYDDQRCSKIDICSQVFIPDNRIIMRFPNVFNYRTIVESDRLTETHCCANLKEQVYNLWIVKSSCIKKQDLSIETVNV